jgi:hypothetical protein
MLREAICIALGMVAGFGYAVFLIFSDYVVMPSKSWHCTEYSIERQGCVKYEHKGAKQ